jgi:hypothetical protein
LSASTTVYVVALAPSIAAQLDVPLSAQRIQTRATHVPDGPVQDPFETVSLAPTTGVPVIVPAEVTFTFAARAGAAPRSPSASPVRAILRNTRAASMHRTSST